MGASCIRKMFWSHVFRSSQGKKDNKHIRFWCTKISHAAKLTFDKNTKGIVFYEIFADSGINLFFSSYTTSIASRVLELWYSVLLHLYYQCTFFPLRGWTDNDSFAWYLTIMFLSFLAVNTVTALEQVMAEFTPEVLYLYSFSCIRCCLSTSKMFMKQLSSRSSKPRSFTMFNVE